MKLLMAPVGSRGDVEPMLVLGEAMRKRAHEILFCAPPETRERAERRGLRFHAVGADFQAAALRHYEVMRRYLAERERVVRRGLGRIRRRIARDRVVARIRGRLDLYRALGRFAARQLPLQLSALLEVAQGADVIIGEAFQLAAPIAADVVGADYRYLVFSPTLLRSTSHPPPLFPLYRHRLPSLVNRTSWRGYQTLLNRGLLDQINRLRAHHRLDPIDDVYTSLMGRTIVAADRELAPIPDDVSVPYTQTDYWVASDAGALDRELEGWIDAGARPIYIGFGSMGDPDPAATTRCMAEAVTSTATRAVLSSGWAQLGGAELPASMCVVGEVSNARLFPRMAAVIHHGGAGTTSVAARAGVPQLVVPHDVDDQTYFGWRAHRLGIAPPPIARWKLTSDGLSRAIRGMLTSAELVERAAELGRRLNACDGVAEGVALLEEIATRHRARSPRRADERS